MMNTGKLGKSNEFGYDRHICLKRRCHYCPKRINQKIMLVYREWKECTFENIEGCRSLQSILRVVSTTVLPH
jgi:hypothetical protein